MRKVNFTFIVFLITITASSKMVFGQYDSLKVNNSFDFESNLLYLSNKEIGIPIHSDYTSNILGEIVEPKFNEVTDNPFRHNAFYTLLKNKTTVNNNFFLELDLLLEHRGMSYGLYDLSNMVVFPYYKFNFSDGIKIFEDSVYLEFNIGSYLNGKVHQGLKVYNIDYQGGNLILSHGNIFCQYIQIGDLSKGIGLQLEEYKDISFGYKLSKVNTRQLKFGINLSINNYAFHPLDSVIFEPFNIKTNNTGLYFYTNSGIWGEYKSRTKTRIYFQYELRNTPYLSITENSGLLLGGEFKINTLKMTLNFNPEFRYYGWVYNFNHRGDSVNYRKKTPDISNNHANTLGRYLYPLMNYNKPFSQWAVYTEYQYQNIAGIELRVNLRKQVYKNFEAELEAENCTLIKEYRNNGKKAFTYLFYSVNLAYNLSNLCKIGIGVNNKSMNLDKHYQTFYMRKEPILHFFIRKELLH